jgi:hypothetical protein
LGGRVQSKAARKASWAVKEAPDVTSAEDLSSASAAEVSMPVAFGFQERCAEHSALPRRSRVAETSERPDHIYDCRGSLKPTRSFFFLPYFSGARLFRCWNRVYSKADSLRFLYLKHLFR